MFVPSTFAVALLMTIFSTICWGSFANTFKGTKNYRFELYYWDYGLGILLIALLLALTMGSFAAGPTAFLANMRTADGLNLFYAALGEKDEAMAWLERAYEERDQWMVYIKAYPGWDALRSEPRFQALVRSMNFPP